MAYIFTGYTITMSHALAAWGSLAGLAALFAALRLDAAGHEVRSLRTGMCIDMRMDMRVDVHTRRRAYFECYDGSRLGKSAE